MRRTNISLRLCVAVEACTLPAIVSLCIMGRYEWKNRDRPKLNTNQITPELIDYIIQKIVTHFKPHQIILFGSQARGDIGTDSDVDLFIVQSGSGSNRQLRREIDMLLAGRRFPLDLIVRKPEDVELNLQDGNPFYVYNLFGEGKVLYEQNRETA